MEESTEVIPVGEIFWIKFDTPVVIRTSKTSAAMVLSDNTGVVGNDKGYVEGVDNNFSGGLVSLLLVFKFACSGPFSCSFLTRRNHL